MLLFTKAKNKGFLTMSEEAQYYYGGKKIIRQVMGFMMFVIEIIWLGNHLNGGAKYLAYVTQMPDVTCKIITVLGFGIYVFIGGYMAVVTTDAVQFIAILIGFLTIAVRAIPLAGGYQNVVDTFTAVGKPGAMTFYGLGSYGVMAAIALVLSTAMGVIGTPTHRTRIYTSKDEKTARKAFLGQGMVNTMLLTRHSTTALPTLRFALGTSFCPRLMLTKAQQPSPIITAMASATTVRGNTTVLAALP